MYVPISGMMMACHKYQNSISEHILTNSSSSKVFFFPSYLVKVIACGFPHLEDRDKTLSIHSENDFFGSGRPTKDEMVIAESSFVFLD